MAKLIVFLLTFFLSTCAWGQEINVIQLDQVDISPNDEIFIFSSYSKKHRENQVRVKGNTSIVMGFLNPEKTSIKVEGLELFFNYDWAVDSSGFYVQPVISREVNGLPETYYEDFPEKYLVTPKLGNRLFIDLTSKNIEINTDEQIYIGLKFLENVNPEIHNIFNITFVNGKIEEYTYLLYPDGREPQEVARPRKNSAGMKYSVMYKLKD